MTDKQGVHICYQIQTQTKTKRIPTVEVKPLLLYHQTTRLIVSILYNSEILL